MNFVHRQPLEGEEIENVLSITHTVSTKRERPALPRAGPDHRQHVTIGGCSVDGSLGTISALRQARSIALLALLHLFFLAIGTVGPVMQCAITATIWYTITVRSGITITSRYTIAATIRHTIPDRLIVYAAVGAAVGVALG